MVPSKTEGTMLVFSVLICLSGWIQALCLYLIFRDLDKKSSHKYAKEAQAELLTHIKHIEISLNRVDGFLNQRLICHTKSLEVILDRLARLEGRPHQQD